MALSSLLHYARPHRRTIWLATLCSILNKLFDIAPELLIGVAVDVVVNQQDSFLARLGFVDLRVQLVLLGAMTLVIWVCESLFEYAYALLWRNLAQTLQHELRLDAYSHLQTLELAWFEDRRSGDLQAILNDDINQLERFLDGGANSLIQVATSVLLIGAIFFALSPGVAALAMLPIPLILMGASRFQRQVAPRYQAVRAQAGAIAARLTNNLAGIATIQSYTAEAHEAAAMARESSAYRAANREAIRVSSAFIPLIRMAILAGFLATMLWGGWLTLSGELAVGAYSALVFLTQRLLWPLTGLAQTLDTFERAMACSDRILGLLRAPVGIVSGTQALPVPVVGHLALEGVTFAYSGRAPVLQAVDLPIPAGQTLALVGATGSGKSTLAKLLLRFYDPSAGRVTLDGIDLRALSLRALRGTIGFVSQDVFLVDGTVRENIAYGLPDASDEAVRAAAALAEAHEFIAALPQGYDTVVGERGQKLSGGQRQRLSIARALLKNPPILVLDEATSAVDNETEAAIQRSLDRIAAGRTTILIAHRLSTIRNAHRIVVLEEGRIVESGTHAALLERAGVYAGLWRVQTGERDAAAVE